MVVNAVNDAPTLDSLDNLTIDEDSAGQTVDLAGITAGADEVQALKLTATSDNTGLVLDPTVSYTSANPTGTLGFTPLADQSGTATITVTVEDAGLDNDLASAGDNATFIRTFDVVVNPVNDAPTLDSLDNLTIDEDAAAQTVNLAGITAGADEVQALKVTATSDNMGLVLDPTVTYTSDESTGSLTFTPVADQSGTATITVTIEDAGFDNQLATTADNATFSRTFLVIVNSVDDGPKLDAINDLTINEDDAQQDIILTGISGGDDGTNTLRVTASSHNPTLIPKPMVTYVAPDATGSLTLQSVVNQHGTATISVTVENPGKDGQLGTGTFESAIDYSIGAAGREFVIADINVDGYLDAIVTADDAVAVLLGEADRSFGEPTNFTVGNSPYSVKLGDFNKDGQFDAATANLSSGDVSILLGIGDGTFGSVRNFAVGPNLSSIDIGDINEDGQLDLIVTNTRENTDQSVSILNGNGDGSFANATHLAVSHNSRPEDVLVTDLNQDGHLDIITANTGICRRQRHSWHTAW